MRALDRWLYRLSVRMARWHYAAGHRWLDWAEYYDGRLK